MLGNRMVTHFKMNPLFNRCGGVLASMTDLKFGLIDNWILTIKDIFWSHKKYLDTIEDWKAKADKLCELNILYSVHRLCNSSILQAAWARGQPVVVHGWCYRLTDGIIRDLDIHVYDKQSAENLLPNYDVTKSHE